MNTHPLNTLVRNSIRLGTITLLLLFFSGCATAEKFSLTHKVWDKAQRPTNRPAPDPKLALFASSTNHDVLAVYDALSEHRDRIERRAYFVHTNDARISARKKPRYADLSTLTNMSSVPVVAPTNVTKSSGMFAAYPVRTDHGHGFELYRDSTPEGTHSLPVYFEAGGTPSRVALTPLAVIGDTLMLAAVIATFGAWVWLHSGPPTSL